MAEYEKGLVEKLMETGEIINLNGVPIEIKEVPDNEKKASLDNRALKFELDMQKHMEKNNGERKALPSIKEIRNNMGGFNYNLNTIEIYTRYIEVETDTGRVPVWIYYPRHMEGKLPAFLYVHGGAFLGGTPFAVENQCRLIAQRGNCVVFNIDYSLAPEHPYPVPCTQVYDVLEYVYNIAGDFNVDKDRIAMGGDSAGGNLTAVCAQMDRDKGTGYLKAQVLLYAKLTFTNHELPGYKRDEEAFDIIQEQKWLLPGMIHIGSDEANAGDERVYVQGRYDIKTPYISPAFGKKEGLAKALILLAEYDGLRLEGEFYAKQLLEAGVPVRVIRYRGVCHGFFDLLGILPQSEAAANEISRLISEL